VKITNEVLQQKHVGYQNFAFSLFFTIISIAQRKEPKQNNILY